MSAADSKSAPKPYALVWAPIPILSWIYPFIGHLGIARSDGTILDFAVDLRQGDMAFGGPARWCPLKPELAGALREQVSLSAARSGASAKSLMSCWDEWLAFTANIYNHRQYSFLTDNCHSFVAYFLNSVRYGDTTKWGPVRLAVLCAWQGRFIDLKGAARTLLPSAATLLLGFHFLGQTAFLTGWCIGLAAIVVWFSFFSQCASQHSSTMLLGV